MQEKYVIVEHENFENHAGAKARKDIADILVSAGWKPLRVTKGDGKGTPDKLRMCFVVVWDWLKVLLKAKRGTEMIIQYPLATYPKVSLLAYPFQWLLAKAKKIKLIYLIHDLDSIRTEEGRSAEKNSEFLFLHLASGIIAHNPVMTKFIKSKGIDCRITEIGIFDYLTDIPLDMEKAKDKHTITVAGNLNQEKAGYLYEMEKHPNALKWQVFGPNFEGTGKGCLQYEGQFPAEELPGKFSAGFGLVWDGDSCETCSGRYGEYLRYNNPHKLSLYLASGLPVIVWKESALADFVRKNRVGLAVGSLQEIEGRIDALDAAEYDEMKKNAYGIAKRLRKGKNTLEAVDRLTGEK